MNDMHNATTVEFTTVMPLNTTLADHVIHAYTKSPPRNGTVTIVNDRYPTHVNCCVPGPVPLAIYIVAPTLLIFLFSLLRCFTKFIRNLMGDEGDRPRNNNAHNLSPREAQQMQKNDTLKKRLVAKFILLKKISSPPEEHKKEDVELEANMKELNEETIDTSQAEGQQNFVTDDRSCPICFDQYGEKPEEVFIGQLKKCGHFYHFHCIWPWLEQKGSCPLCRENIKLKETDIRGTTLEHVLVKRKEEARKKNELVAVNVIDEVTNQNADKSSSSSTNQNAGIDSSSSTNQNGGIDSSSSTNQNGGIDSSSSTNQNAGINSSSSINQNGGINSSSSINQNAGINSSSSRNYECFKKSENNETQERNSEVNISNGVLHSTTGQEQATGPL